MKHCILGAGLLASMAGCRVYHTLPLDNRNRPSALTTADLNRVSVQVRELKHPLLAPQPVDLRDGLSPEEAALLAVLINPDLRAVRDQRAMAQAQLLDAGLLPDPVLALTRDVPVGGAAAVTAYSEGLSLDLPAMLTTALRRRAAHAAQTSVDLDVAWQEWQVAQAAKLSVYRQGALAPQAAWADESVSALEESLRALEAAAASGSATLNELAEARSALDGARRAALTLHQSLEQERANLNGLLGLSPKAAVKLEPPRAGRSWTDLPAEEDLARTLPQRLDLVALSKGYESEDARLRLAVWSQFPSIGLAFSRSRDTSGLVTRGAGVSISLPLFNRGQGAVAVEEATRAQLYDQYQARLFHARADLAQACSDLAFVREMLAAAQLALPSLEAQARASETAFRAGHLDLPGRNQARLALLAQKSTLTGLQSTLDELGVALEIAAGRSLRSPEMAR